MKTKLRSIKLLERLRHNALEKSRKDELIIKKISQLDVFKKAGNILFYLSIHGEVDLINLFEQFNQTKKFILPRVQEKKLQLFIVKNLQETETGNFKILEPKTHLPKMTPGKIDLALIPGIVFSKNGHRIGYGKGYYDRLLKTTNCVKIGIAYDFQIVENIEGQEHDIPMDIVITEKEVIKCP